jgi:hypothetical protein
LSVAFNTAEGWLREVSEDVADELRRRRVDRGETPASLLEFLNTYDSGRLQLVTCNECCCFQDAACYVRSAAPDAAAVKADGKDSHSPLGIWGPNGNCEIFIERSRLCSALVERGAPLDKLS